MTDAPDTNNEVFHRLRLETIEQMGFDAIDLKSWQETRVHCVSVLRLELDRLTAEALAGREIDPKSVASINEQLERLLHPSFGGDSPEAHQRENTEASEHLSKLITNLHDARKVEEAPFFEKLNAAIDKGNPVGATLVLLDLLDHSKVTDESLERFRSFITSMPALPVTIAVEDQGADGTLNDPPSPAKVVFLDAACDADEPPPAPPLPNPARFSSLGNPNAVPTPRTAKPISPVTQSFFDNVPGSGMDRWSPRRNW
jgi:hypothetical protein